jgi:hypothetical protein
LRDEQNAEFRRGERDARQAEQAEQRRRATEQTAPKSPSLEQLVAALPQEPAKCVTIAGQMIDGRRIQRRFDPAQRVKDVEIWVCGNGTLELGKIELMYAAGGALDPAKTLAVQKLDKGRFLVSVCLK